MTLYDPHTLPLLAPAIPQDIRLLRELVELRLLIERLQATPGQIKQVFRYYGGKTRMAGRIVDLFPAHDGYIEPCLGSGAVYFAKPPSPFEVLSDIDGEVIHFFKMLRERPDDLIRAIVLTPYHEGEFIACFGPAQGNDIERARRFYARLEMGWNGAGVRHSGFRRERTLSRDVSVTVEYMDVLHVYQAAARLQHAQIDRADVRQQITRYNNPRNLFYLDLPYVYSTRGAGKRMYHHEMTDEEHREIAALCHESKAMFILSGYQSALYDEIYADWNRQDFETYDINGNAQIECVWISPNAVKIPNTPPIYQRSFLED